MRHIKRLVKKTNRLHLLFDENIKINKRVFMTAGKKIHWSSGSIVSMDDYDAYGETFEFLSFKDALDEDPPILSDYKIVTVMVGNDEIAEMVKTGKFVKPSRVNGMMRYRRIPLHHWWHFVKQLKSIVLSMHFHFIVVLLVLKPISKTRKSFLKFLLTIRRWIHFLLKEKCQHQ